MDVPREVKRTIAMASNNTGADMTSKVMAATKSNERLAPNQLSRAPLCEAVIGNGIFQADGTVAVGSVDGNMVRVLMTNAQSLVSS